MEGVTEYLQKKSVPFRVGSGGSQVVLKTCPTCPPHKNEEDNLWKLYVYLPDGKCFCHRCRCRMSWLDYKKSVSRGGSPVLSSQVALSGGTRSTILSPPAVDEIKLVHPRELKTYIRNISDVHPEVMEYLTGSGPGQRGLSKEVVKKYKVGSTEQTFLVKSGNDEGLPEKQTLVCVTFPWIVPNLKESEGDTKPRYNIVRTKLRSIEKKSCMRLYPKGGGWGLFGLHTVPHDAEAVVLTEGEYDAMAVYDGTKVPAVSLPNGASSLPVGVLPHLERFKKIYLWMDDDIPGREGAMKFAKKLGASRCLIVSTKGSNSDGPKDANDALRQGVDMVQLLKDAKPLPHSNIATFADFMEDVRNEILNPAGVSGKVSTTLPGLSSVLKGFRAGELTLFSGPTGSGKTTLLSQLSLDFCNQGVATLWGSFELPNVRLAKKMLIQNSQVDEDTLRQNYDAYAEKFCEMPLYFLRFHGSTAVDEVLDAMEHAVYVYDVDHVVLDNLQFMCSDESRGADRFIYQDYVVSKFRKFATMKNIHISLVVHPRKMDQNGWFGLESVFGGVKITQEADNVVILQKDDPVCKHVEVLKNRFDGDLGRVPIRFEKNMQRFRELKEGEYTNMKNMYLSNLQEAKLIQSNPSQGRSQKRVESGLQEQDYAKFQES